MSFSFSHIQHNLFSSYPYQSLQHFELQPLRHDGEESSESTKKGEGRRGDVVTSALGCRAGGGAGTRAAAAAGSAARACALTAVASNTTLDDAAGTGNAVVGRANAANIGGGGDDASTEDGVELRRAEVVESTDEVGCTSNVGKHGHRDGASETGVVLDVQRTSVLGVDGERQAGHLVVVVDDQTVGAGECRKSQVGEAVAGDGERTSGVDELHQVDGRAVADGNAASGGEVTEGGDCLSGSVSVQVEASRQRRQWDVDVCQVLVVGNGDS